MRLDLLPTKPMELMAPQESFSDSKPEAKEGFQDVLRNALRDVDKLQKEADHLSEAFVRGEVEDLHQVIVAAEKARIGLELTVNISNKLVQGYQELNRMQL